MASPQTETEVFYNPSALLSIFSSTLNNETTRKVFKVKGIYLAGKGANYNGSYYDSLKDETSEATMTLVVPALIRSKLNHSETIEFYAYLSKKVQLNGGRIDLHLNMVELLAINSPTYTEDQLKAFDILERKAETGRKDVDSLIKSKIINGESITVNIIVGKSAIIDEDIKHQLQDAIAYYKFYFLKINLTSVREIIQNLNHYQRKCDILAIARGCGENLEVFESTEMAEAALSLSTPFITALSHKENVPLLPKVADKAFITPTALGQYFNDIYNNTVAELQNSKAKLVESITRQLDGNYRKQIENLNESILSIEKSTQKEVSMLTQQLQAAKEEKEGYTRQIQDLQSQVRKAGGISITAIVLIIAALIIGLLLGKAFM